MIDELLLYYIGILYVAFGFCMVGLGLIDVVGGNAQFSGWKGVVKSFLWLAFVSQFYLLYVIYLKVRRRCG